MHESTGDANYAAVPSPKDHTPSNIQHPNSNTFANEVTKIFYANTIIHLIGTAHFSQKSNDIVTSTIKTTKPDAVFLELCQERKALAALTDDQLKLQLSSASNSDSSFSLVGLLQKASSSAQESLEAVPGGEMRAAYRACKSLDNKCTISYGDRRLTQTLSRALDPLSYYSKAKLGIAFLTAIREAEEITKKDVEEAMNEDNIMEFIEEMREGYPEFSNALVDERNLYMAGNLQRMANKFESIVAVMGAGHVPGVLEIFNQGRHISDEEMFRLSQKAVPYRWSGATKMVVWCGFALGVGLMVKPLRKKLFAGVNRFVKF